MNCNKKRVSLNRRTSSLHLGQEDMLATSSSGNSCNNEYACQLAASALHVPPTAIILKNTMSSAHSPAKKIDYIPRLLKSSLRPANKSVSAPCSPTHVVSSPKTVQFHPTQLEHVCLFRKAQTPSTISSRKEIFWADDDDSSSEPDQDDDHSNSSSEEEDEGLQGQQQIELVHVNWPTNQLSDIIDRKNKMIRVEKNGIYLSEDKDYLIGKIAVRNLDYHKTVNIRYTFDFWNTVHNKQAQFHEASKGFDWFTFKVALPQSATSTTMYFAVNYKVGQQEFWDNNRSRNYELQILKRSSNQLKKSSSKSGIASAASIESEDLATKRLPKKNAALLSRYDFSKSIESAKNTSKPLLPSVIHINNTTPLLAAKPSASPTIPSFSNSQKSASIPIPTIKNNYTSTAANATTISPHYSPYTATTNTTLLPPSVSALTDLDSQSYLDLVNKYCFYSTSPSRSPMSING